MNKELISQKHIRVMNRFEREFLPSVFRAVKKYIKSFIKDAKSEGVDYALKNLDRQIGDPLMTDVILNIYVKTGSYFADRTLYELRAEARKESKGFGLNIDWVRELLQYFNSLLLSKAVIPITETTKQKIREVLIESQRQGWGVNKIISELDSDDLAYWRARMIVRTETNKAMYYGQKLGESKSEFESVKMWIAARDHRTRHSHRDVNGKVVDSMTKFSVPVYRNIGGAYVQIGTEYMDGPGDPNATAGNVINCRCTTSRRLKRVNGMLVPKSLPGVSA